jgi:hypothetical protein
VAIKFYCPACASEKSNYNVLAMYQIAGTVYCGVHADKEWKDMVLAKQKKNREGSAYRITGKELPQSVD